MTHVTSISRLEPIRAGQSRAKAEEEQVEWGPGRASKQHPLSSLCLRSQQSGRVVCTPFTLSPRIDSSTTTPCKGFLAPSQVTISLHPQGLSGLSTHSAYGEFYSGLFLKPFRLISRTSPLCPFSVPSWVLS